MRRRVRGLAGAARSALARGELALFHEFAPPPGGGGHQFLRALQGELERGGVRVANNALPRGARACLYNSFNFDFGRLRRAARPGVRMVHRVDGPIALYRGFDDGTDERILEVNAELAQATVFQSRFSLDAHRELGLELASPVVIPNAVDPSLFHDRGREPFSRGRKLRLFSSSWSDNPNKGAPAYRELERLLDWTEVEWTFAGRTQVEFEHIRTVGAVDSRTLASLLREHDVFVTASLNDPCSNALLEALACGLPAVYARSGGHPELAGEAGFAFDELEQVPALLERLAGEYEQRQAAISSPRLADVAARYREVLEL